MRNIICPVTIVILLTTFSVATETDGPLSSIHDRAESLAKAYGKLDDPDVVVGRRETLDCRARVLDRQLAFEVFRLLAKERTRPELTATQCIEKMAKETSGIVSWRRFPSHITHQSRLDDEFPKNANPCIYYLCSEGADRSGILVLQNSFAGLRCRLNPSLYVIRFDPDGVEFKLLPQHCNHAGCEWSSFQVHPTNAC